MSEAELKYGNTGPMKKAVVAKKQIRKGERLSKNNLWFKRTMEESSVKQKDFSRLIGLEVTGDIGKDEIVDFSKVKYEFQKQDLKTLGLKEKK
jgi:sialic acid synthase SpsE